MTKVYQITECSFEEYDYNNESRTIGIFTDKEVAEGILSKLNSDMENRLNELYADQDKFDKYKECEVDYEIRNLQKTSYYMQEYNINQLYK
jgi:hypothetical protein